MQENIGMTLQKESENSEEELARGRAVSSWIQSGLQKKGWRVADLHRATNISKGYLSRITKKNGINTTTGAYSRIGEDKIDAIGKALGIDVNDGRRAAGYSAVPPETLPVIRRFVIGEYNGKPVELMTRQELTEEALKKMRLATKLILGEGESD